MLNFYFWRQFKMGGLLYNDEFKIAVVKQAAKSLTPWLAQKAPVLLKESAGAEHLSQQRGWLSQCI